MVSNKTSLITDIPVTASARQRYLEELLGSDVPHWGELFVPDENFYIGGTISDRANHMLRRLCEWLGVKPGYFAVELEGGEDYTDKASRYRIYVESAAQTSEFVMAAVLAHALTRYWLEDRKLVHLPEQDQQAALRATASIELGLGIVICNGLIPHLAWPGRRKHSEALQRQILGDIPRGQYIQLFKSFLRYYRIPAVAYQKGLAPWTARWLRVPLPNRPIHAVKAARHHRWIMRAKLAGAAWAAATLVLLGMYIWAHRAMPRKPEVQAAQEQVQLLHNLVQLCKDTAAYDRRYTDATDVLTAQNLNAEQNRCVSLENRYLNAQAAYEQVIKH
jgi:hypothetical protein